MKFEYFTDSDTLVLEFTSGRVSETVDVTVGVIAHIDTDGSIMGLEIDRASNHLRSHDLSNGAPKITWAVDPVGSPEPVAT